jgi:hypothetical protein
VISVTERQAYIGRVRALAKKCADAFRLTEAGADAVNAESRHRGGHRDELPSCRHRHVLVAGYAFYEEVAFEPGNEIRLMPVAATSPRRSWPKASTGIDADSSPLRSAPVSPRR